MMSPLSFEDIENKMKTLNENSTKRSQNMSADGLSVFTGVGKGFSVFSRHFFKKPTSNEHFIEAVLMGTEEFLAYTKALSKNLAKK